MGGVVLLNELRGALQEKPSVPRVGFRHFTAFGRRFFVFFWKGGWRRFGAFLLDFVRIPYLGAYVLHIFFLSPCLSYGKSILAGITFCAIMQTNLIAHGQPREPRQLEDSKTSTKSKNYRGVTARRGACVRKRVWPEHRLCVSLCMFFLFFWLKVAGLANV